MRVLSTPDNVCKMFNLFLISCTVLRRSRRQIKWALRDVTSNAANMHTITAGGHGLINGARPRKLFNIGRVLPKMLVLPLPVVLT